MIQEEDIRSNTPFNLFYEGLRTDNRVVSKPNKYIIYFLSHIAKKYSMPICFVKIYHYNKKFCAVRDTPLFQLFRMIFQSTDEVRLDFKLITPDKINGSEEILDSFKDLYTEYPSLEMITASEVEHEQPIIDKQKNI